MHTNTVPTVCLQETLICYIAGTIVLIYDTLIYNLFLINS